MIFKNKGEWSELYTALKLLANGKMNFADKDLVITGEELEVIEVHRKDESGYKKLIRENGNVNIYINDTYMKSIPCDEFESKANFLFYCIKLGRTRTDIQRDLEENPTNTQGFPVPEIEEFMNECYIDTVSQSPSLKGDITLRVKDLYSNSSILSYSIKTNYITSKPTIINASEATNFVYKLDNMDDEKMNAINSLNNPRSKIKDRMYYMMENNIGLHFWGVYRPMTQQNLRMVDSLIPEIMSKVLQIHYITNEYSIKEVVKILAETEPCNFIIPDYEHHYKAEDFYIYKIKKLLVACSLGLDPGKRWDFKEEALGGMIIVNDDGGIIVYNLHNRNLYEDFLYNSVKFERSSTTRHKYAKVEKINDNYYFKLNMQIRYF